MSKFLNFPSAVVRIESIKALGVMIDRQQIPTGMAAPPGQVNMRVNEIPVLIAYTSEGSINLGQVRDHETAIEVKDLFFAFCEENITADEFHEALGNLAEDKQKEDEEKEDIKKQIGEVKVIVSDPSKN